MKKTKPINSRSNSDGAWKAIILLFFQEFMAFFLPSLHEQIDYSIPPEFLDKEMEDIHGRFGKTKRRITDKLVKVYLKSGEFKVLMIHVEVQNAFEKLFAEKMFLYFSMLFFNHRQPIEALVIFTGKRLPKPFDHFELSTPFNTKMRYDFNAYVAMAQDENELIKSENPFAYFVLAHIYMNKTKGKNKKLERLELKKKLYELIEDKISLEKYEQILIFVDEIVKLDVGVEEEYQEFIKTKSVMKNTESKWMEEATVRVANQMAARAYGKTVDEIIEEQKSERAERKTEREIINRALVKKQTPSLIAQEMGLEVALVEGVIAAFAFQ